MNEAAQPSVVGNLDAEQITVILRVHRQHEEAGQPVEIRHFQFSDRDVAATFVESTAHDPLVVRVEAFDLSAIFDKVVDANAPEIIIPEGDQHEYNQRANDIALADAFVLDPNRIQ